MKYNVLNTLLQIEKSEISLKVELRKRIIFEKNGWTIDRSSSIYPLEHNFWEYRAFRRAATIERRLYARKMT